MLAGEKCNCGEEGRFCRKVYMILDPPQFLCDTHHCYLPLLAHNVDPRRQPGRVVGYSRQVHLLGKAHQAHLLGYWAPLDLLDSRTANRDRQLCSG